MLGQCNYNQHSASATTHKSRKSKRWRTVCEQQMAEASHSFCGNDEQNSAVMANEDLLVGTASHIDNSIMGDIGNSELSKFPSISDLGKIEKMLTQCDHNQNSASETTHKSRKSKRWRTVCQQQTAEASHSLCGNDEQNSAIMVNEDLLVGTASHIDNSIMGDMPSNTISRRTRRMLRQCDRTENCAPTNVFFTSDESHQVISRKSKRWKAASQQPATEALDTFSANHEQNVAAPINENLLVGTASHIDSSITEGQSSHSRGQASYQRTKQGLIITYEDLGDNIYTCSHCNACFWLEEAIKQHTTDGLPIYTNCCAKGKIKLNEAKPTPNFLEQLLDPNKGLESRVFRENIRVYNSMFSFTSMGATIDRKINNGSGPYVFKISGQVHHLMGSILPHDGECPKYAQLYVYDTKNEATNRINAIDPTPFMPALLSQ